MIGSLVIFLDLGNVIILVLVVLIMYIVSGIVYCWFIVFIGVLVGVLVLFLLVIFMIGVDKFLKVLVFGYVVKCFSVYFNFFVDLVGVGY